MLTPAEDRALRQYCNRHGLSASEVVRGCLKRFLEAEGVGPASGSQNEKGGR